MSKFTINVRSRPVENQPICQRNQRFLSRLQSELTESSWNFSKDGGPILEDKPGRMSHMLSVTKFLPSSVTGYINFTFSGDHYLKDHASHDDSIILKLNAKKYPLKWFLEEIFVHYISAFSAYFASIRSEAIALEVVNLKDERMNQGRDPNLRVNMIWLDQVNYLDNHLLQRTLGVTVDKAFRKLDGNIEFCRIVGDGILFGDELDACVDDIEQAISLEAKFRKLLAI